MPTLRALAAVVPLLFAQPAAAQTPALVRDLNTTQLCCAGSAPSGFARVGAYLYFAASRTDVGRELFRTDGLPGGTSLVADCWSGWGLHGNPTSLTGAANQLFFLATDQNGTEPWRSDGTAAGTVRLRDIKLGAEGSTQAGQPMAAFGNQAVFAAIDGVSGTELWVSDGTAAGTLLLKDINPGAAASMWLTDPLSVLGNAVLFAAGEPPTGKELWRTDGTTAGTYLVKDIRAGFASSNPVLGGPDVAGAVYFAADDGTSGVELWRSDGTQAGTYLVRDINPGPGASSPRAFTGLGSLVYFVANDGASGDEVWVSDGTAAGTRLVIDLIPGAASANPYSLTTMGSALYFGANAPYPQLWRSDGTAAGTMSITPPTVLSAIVGLVATDNLLFFTTDNWTSGREPWVSDGTAAGTFLIREIMPGNVGSYPDSFFRNPAGSGVVFAAVHPVVWNELTVSDGTTGGTLLLADINDASVSSSPTGVDLHGTMLLAANDDAGPGLWRSDGSPAGTTRLAGLSRYTSLPRSYAVLGGLGLFGAPRLWRSDGTPAGTTWIPVPSGVGPRQLLRVGDAVFFFGWSAQYGDELWITDGTAQGTRLVKDIRSGPQSALSSFLGNYRAAVGTVCFGANDGLAGDELWCSDGTASGTVMVKDIEPGPGSSRPAFFAPMGGTLFFGATDSANGWELWRTDGTGSGTALGKDIWPGPSGSNPGFMTASADMLFFPANDGITGFELWKSDGTGAGTVLVADIAPGSQSSFNGESGVAGDTLFFAADDGTYGKELWATDGTALNTRLVFDIHPGTNGSYPQRFMAIGSRRVVFSVLSSPSGTGLWVSDGTAAGTYRFSMPPATADNVRPLALSSGLLFFAADDRRYGDEPWVLHPGATAQVEGAGCAPGVPPALRASDPVLGQVMQVSVRGPAVGASGVLVIGGRTVVRLPGAGCELYVDPGLLLAAQPFAVGASGWSMPIGIPNSPALGGVGVMLQAAVAPSPMPLGFDQSNGVVATLGK